MTVIGEDDTKIDVAVDLINEKLIFSGRKKIKFHGTTNWTTLAVEEYPIGETTNVDKYFNTIVKNLHDKMQRRVELLELARTFLHEVTEVEIIKE